jgi:putative phosphoesterase
VLIAIFSDIHANLPALEKFVKCTKNSADAYICLGDVVNYGPWNDECLELIYSLPELILIEGNHEKLFLGVEPIEHELPLVQEFFDKSIQFFSRRDLITNLTNAYEIGSFVCTHTVENKKIYMDSDIEVTRNYIIGHTHHQFKIERSDKVIINCGSIGQNRKYINILNFALYDTSSGSITLSEELYPIEKFLEELAVRGYSQRCLNYYLSKQRRVA